MDRYLVLGNPIAQSRSPWIHRAFAAQTGQALSYDRLCPPVDGFSAAAKTFFAEGGRGMNVTAPFKLDAFNFADQLSPRARMAGAVNTLAVQAGGQILGDNTDGCGLVYDLVERLHWPLRGKQILVLGAGGAVRGALQPLLACAPAQLQIANRSLAKAEALAREFSAQGTVAATDYPHLDMTGFDLVINATSAGLAGGVPPLPSGQLRDDCRCYDMTYSASATPFQGWAKSQGAVDAVDGLGMLVAQAAESFYLWRGVRPDIRPVLSALRAALAQAQ